MLFNFKKIIKFSTGITPKIKFNYVNPKKYKSNSPLTTHIEKTRQH